jgi:hypothetical protein
MRFLIGNFVIACFRLAPLAHGATNTLNFTTSKAEIDTLNVTNVTQQVNTFQVEIMARMQNGAVLFDQTYNAPISDPTVQAAITQAHLDVADGQVPVSCLLTSASAHDSQVAIPLACMTAKRVTSLYDLVDRGYESTHIGAYSRSLGAAQK